MRKRTWFFSFFIGAPAALISAFLILLSTSYPQTIAPTPLPLVLGMATQLDPQFSFPLPEMTPHLKTADARSLIIKKYLRRYSSPLEPYSKLIVEISDKYSLDYRLLVAIAQQESNLCKRIPPNSHNCWGFGIYGDKVTRFDNYPQALETVAKGLKKNYIDQGLVTPEQIMVKYTPPSVEIGGPWARGVNSFMEDLE